VYVNGELRGETPAVIRGLAFGEHTVAVIAPGRPRWEQRVTLTAERPSQSLGPDGTSSAATAEPRLGSLRVESRPAGAQVWVDGALIGTAPLVLSRLGTGAHAVRLELPGYRPWFTSVTINPGEQARVAASLEQ
jgi:hypothetical protein